jgi:hypothetical protein
VPKIDVAEEQILESLDQLSPKARQEAVRRLLPTARYLERAVQRNRARIEAVSQERGLDWNTLTEEQRERLIDEILHE